jgi:ADP-glucose pyrophosphorylase
MAVARVFGMVLAGGEGKRLMPLTADRAKPAVPFAGSYRLIDFALSNLLNSGLRRIVVLTQYKSHSLDRHISQTWRMSPLLGGYVASIPAQQRLGKRWYTGSADAILQSMNALSDERPDYVVVVGADHVYRMDFDQMLQAHIESGMEASVAAIRQPISLASQFGVIEVDEKSPGKISALGKSPATQSPFQEMILRPWFRWETTFSMLRLSSTRFSAMETTRAHPTIWVETSSQPLWMLGPVESTTSHSTRFPVPPTETSPTGEMLEP